MTNSHLPRLDPIERPQRLSDKVAERIAVRIREAQLGPGDRLPSERQLAEHLHVARTVVREAIRDLTTRGVVSVRPGIGLVVAANDGSSATEALSRFVSDSLAPGFERIQEVRRPLEIEIARLAAERATPQDLQELGELVRAQAAAPDLESAVQADLEVHRGLARATQNPLFLLLLDAMRESMLAVRRESLVLRGNRAKGVAAHDLIVRAIAAHAPKEARREMARHFDESEQEFFSGGLDDPGRA